MNAIKLEKINSAIKREIRMILATEIKDDSIKFVTITAVKTTNDLSFAKVYITVFNPESKAETLASLKSAKGFIRKELAGRLEIRHIPQLEFVYDDSIEYGMKIEERIKEIHNK
jgi:ribosome-binding factor A